MGWTSLVQAAQSSVNEVDNDMTQTLRFARLRPDLSNARLVFRPDPAMRPPPNSPIPVFLDGPGMRRIIPQNLRFDGRPLTLALARELSGGRRLIGWGPVSEGQDEPRRLGTGYIDGQIWIAEELDDGYRMLWLSDEKPDRSRGLRNGYRILARIRTTTRAIRRDTGSWRMTVTQRIAVDTAAGQSAETARRPAPNLPAMTESFREIGSIEQWVRYHYRGAGQGDPDAPPTIFRAGVRARNAQGNLLYQTREDLPLPYVPYTTSQNGQAYGRRVEGWFLMGSSFLDFASWGYAGISVVTGVGAGLATLFGAAPLAAALGITAAFAALLSWVASSLSWLNTNYVAPFAGEVAGQLYDWAHGIHSVPGTDANGQIIEDDSFFDISNGDPWSEGFGQSELWEFMESLDNDLMEPDEPEEPAPSDDDGDDEDEDDEEEEDDTPPDEDDGDDGSDDGDDGEDPGPEPPVSAASASVLVIVPPA